MLLQVLIHKAFNADLITFIQTIRNKKKSAHIFLTPTVEFVSDYNLSGGLKLQSAMTSTNGMFAIVYGPASPPDGTSPEDYEAAEALRRE